MAEDSKTDVFFIKEALGEANVDADLHVVSDGDTAIRFLDAIEADEKAPCPALIMLDLNLPKRSGAEILRHLRECGRCKNARVLIVSSSDAPSDHAAVAGADIAGYFKKPSEYSEYMKLGPIVQSLLSV